MADLKAVSLKEVDAFLAKHPDINHIDILASDLVGNFFGKRYPISDLLGFAKNGLTIPRAMYVLSATSESMAEAVGFGAEDGDPDMNVDIAPGSLSVVHWGDEPRAQALLQSRAADILVDPRRALSQVLDRFATAGLSPVVAFELEFTFFEKERGADGTIVTVPNPKTGKPDKPIMLGSERLDDFEDVLSEIVANCDSQGIGTGAICAEYGAGQFEINFPHYDDPLCASDHAQLFRRTVKAVARKHGKQASFIAKPGLNRAGNGQHLHISVLDAKGNNIFSAGDTHADPLMHAIGGLQQAARESMLFWAPNVNSYRRFAPENCTPTGATWAHEHRHVGFRIPLAKNNAWRIENRIPGADANCYLSLATSLAGILHGIENKVAPSAETVGAPGMDDSLLPLSIHDAIAATRDAKILNEYFSADFTALFANHREGELNSLNDFISPRELDWYL